jgi:hypothetical protein
VAFSNPLPAPLHEGPVDVSVGDDFLLTAQLHTAAPGSTAELGLGVEEAIKVARNTRFAERSSGLLGGGLKLEHEITFEIANLLQRPARIEVRERIPVTRQGDERVRVEVEEVDPPWERYEQPARPVEGAYRWLTTVPAGDSETLRVRYVVGLSAKHEIAGGNRREQ